MRRIVRGNPVCEWSDIVGIWGELIVDSFLRPKLAARRVLELRPSLNVLVEAAIAVTCIGMILGFVAMRFNPGALDPATAFILDNPLVGALLQAGILATGVFFIVRIGRFFGGTGDVGGALAIVVWLDFVMVLIQAAQVAALALFPPLATLLSLAAVIWALWALACFVGELHDFENTVVVLGGVILSMTVLFLGAAFVLAFLGAPTQGQG
jgi:Yip1 domain